MTRILLCNGPNLSQLGRRDPSLYGAAGLDEVVADARAHAEARGAELDHVQSEHEGALVARLHTALDDGTDGVVINPGGYSHTSVALRDAIELLEVPVIEVHLSNVHAREPFRHTLMTGAVADGVIAGLGPLGYRLAIDAICEQLEAA